MDWGEIEIAPKLEGCAWWLAAARCGVSGDWKTNRPGDVPREPVRVPLYPAQYALLGIGMLAAAGGIAWLPVAAAKAERCVGTRTSYQAPKLIGDGVSAPFRPAEQAENPRSS